MGPTADWPSILVAIFTGLTVLAVMFAGLYPTISNRPKVNIESITRSGWYKVFRTQAESGLQTHHRTEIHVALVLKNNGLETSVVSAWYSCELSNQKEKHVWHTNNVITISPSQRLETTITLSLPIENGVPKDGETLKGTLTLEPSGNRRLVFGEKHLQERLNVRHDQSLSIHNVM